MNFHVLHHFMTENEMRVQYNKISKRNAHIHEQNKIFELLENEFRENLRLSKEGYEIYNQIRDHLEVET